MKVKSAIAFAVLLSAPANGQEAIDKAPPAFQNIYRNMINAADLRLKYCSADNCIFIPSPCIGQCCDQSIADSYGHGKARNVPDGYHYAGWICKPYGETTPGLRLSGDAKP